MRPSSFPPKLQKFVDSVEEKAKQAGKPASLARIYGAWSACFVRFCTVNDRSWRDPSHVSAFLNYLSNRKEIDDASRERVAKSLAFLFEDLLGEDVGNAAWHPDHRQAPASSSEAQQSSPRTSQDPSSQTGASRKQSSQKQSSQTESSRTKQSRSTEQEADKKASDEGEQSNLLTRLLFHTSLPISEAMELCAGDVDLDSGLIYVSDAMGTPKQIVELPDELHEPIENHLDRLREKHGPRYFNAPLFQARALQGRVEDIDESEEGGDGSSQQAQTDSEPVPADPPPEDDSSERPASLWGYVDED